MEFRKCTLVDALDRVLDRGLFLDADLVVYVSGIPLIAARIRAVVSAVETMIAHGFTEERWLLPDRFAHAKLVNSPVTWRAGDADTNRN
ncbi:MAG: gas vesicle protein [Cyanobacteria bacterium NC_groundwater_1444_Ag_S-0.65um_54_12]|nr:gas vesicle protein [Cyanobacteria bacterium NC_groundwater_1444_Ag_S-0.65um_54_12]